MERAEVVGITESRVGAYAWVVESREGKCLICAFLDGSLPADREQTIRHQAAELGHQMIRLPVRDACSRIMMLASPGVLQ